MSAPNDGGPAFPCHTNPRPDHLSNAPQGMTLRDWFAGMALQGLISHIVGVADARPEGYAKRAHEYADAMLAARERKEAP